MPDSVAYITDLRGGRNGIDNILDPRFPFTQCVEALNVDFFSCPIGGKRGGADLVSLAGGTAFSSGLKQIIRYVPGGDEGAAEMWGIDGAAPPIVKRLAGGAAWADVAITDAITGSIPDINGVTFNGKLFLFYDSAVDRLHCWDGTSFRRVGLQTPTAAATVANTGGGAYAAVLRYYRVRWLHVTGGVITRRSEPSASVSFTPSGAGTAARVTRPAAPGEGETHWELEGSTDNITFYQIFGFEQGGTQIAIATTTGDDSVVTSAYSIRALSAVLGTYTVPTSLKFGVTDGNRLVAVGSYEGGLGSRVYWGPVLGSLNKGDDERIPSLTATVNYLDINEKDGGQATGIGGPVNGTIWLFKYRQIWRFTPTGDINVPYLARKISDVVGAINHKSIVLAEDALGNPAIYFWSAKGPHRLGINGLEYLGRDIEDYSRGIKGKENSKVNLSATTIPVHGKYYSDKSQVWWWVATGNSNTPNVKFILDVKQAVIVDRFGIRGGWAVHTGLSCQAYASEMFSNTIGASMSRDLKPYVASTTGSVLYRCDTSAKKDDQTLFQAYIKTRSLIKAEQLGGRFSVPETILAAKGSSGVIIQQTLLGDFEKFSQPSTVDLTPQSGETDDVIRQFEDSMMSDVGVIQVQLGDSAAVETVWELDVLKVPILAIGDL